MEKINVAELLKDCPSGIELDCAIYDNVYFDKVTSGMIKCFIKNDARNTIYFQLDGTYLPIQDAKCVIFPKGKTTWEGFQRPYKDGDVVVCKEGGVALQVFILKSHLNNNKGYCYTGYDLKNNKFFEAGIWYFDRLATEEEKEKFFKVIKNKGYRWSNKTKTLEKLPEFKAGDVLVSTAGNIVLCSHIDDSQVVHFHCRLSSLGEFEIKNDIGVGKSFHCTLAPDTEKQRLFDKLKSAGYKYNPQANKLEKLIEPKFKVGNRIKSKINQVVYTITEVREDAYLVNENTGKFSYHIPISGEENYELISDKFDIATLKPFDKVLVRRGNNAWHIQFFEKYDKRLNYPFVCMNNSKYTQCIPYKDNEYLVNTTDDCASYYKTWK